jgi:hypothetical protein
VNRYCRHPDRDVPKIVCGYPLPCPYHTVLVDLSAEPVPTVTIPVTSDAMAPRARKRVRDVVGAIVQVGDGNSMVVKRKRR